VVQEPSTGCGVGGQSNRMLRASGWLSEKPVCGLVCGAILSSRGRPSLQPSLNPAVSWGQRCPSSLPPSTGLETQCRHAVGWAFCQPRVGWCDPLPTGPSLILDRPILIREIQQQDVPVATWAPCVTEEGEAGGALGEGPLD
jgi:hypothetical protein